MIVQCELCEAPFGVGTYEKKRGRGRYCSQACAGYARRKRAIVTCEECGADYFTVVSRSERAKYCSVECSNRGRNNRVRLRCEMCSTPFEVFPSRIRKAEVKYCSRKCYHDCMRETKAGLRP